jgi:monoamine oxidase
MKSSILVIGAGAAGLFTARELQHDGYDVSIAEARNRVGGRIFSIREGFSKTVEAGAEFVHGFQPITNRLLSECGAKTKPLTGKWISVSNGQWRPLEQFDEQWEELIEAMDGLENDEDLNTFLSRRFSGNAYASLRQSVRKFVEGYDAADCSRVSVFALRDEWKEQDDDAQFHIEGGYDVVVDFLRKDFESKGGKLFLDTEVVSIEWTAELVRATTRSGRTLEAAKAVITVPMSLLQRNMIRFSPALPYGEDVFAAMGIGAVIKFVFEFKTPFWEQHPMANDLAFVISDADVPTWWTQAGREFPLLTGWLGGPSAAVPQKKEELFIRAVRSLSYIFGLTTDEVLSSIATWRIEDWQSDRFAGGAYAYPTVESSRARSIITTPVEQTLYFAGEALYDGPAMGTVEAAFSSGQAVVNLITKKQGSTQRS